MALDFLKPKRTKIVMDTAVTPEVSSETAVEETEQTFTKDEVLAGFKAYCMAKKMRDEEWLHMTEWLKASLER